MRVTSRVEPLGRWPERHEPGRFVIGCSCRRWTFTGTAEEISKAAAAHDDSPFTRHIVGIRGKVVSPQTGQPSDGVV